MTEHPTQGERPSAGAGFRALGCLSVGLQLVLGIVIFLIVLSQPIDPGDEGVLRLVKTAFVAIWIVSTVLLIAEWARRSRLIIVVAVAAFAFVWVAGTFVAERFPYVVSFAYGP